MEPTQILLKDDPPTWELGLLGFLLEGNVPRTYEAVFTEDIIEELDEKVGTSLCIVPPVHRVFATLYRVSVEQVRCVVLGQDPYHSVSNDGIPSATGYAFEVSKGVKLNPSLRNIYKELDECGYVRERDGTLSTLYKQGVLLLNTALTTVKGVAGEHTKEWNGFTENLIAHINSSTKVPVVWLLMGGNAIAHKDDITHQGGLTVCSSHPSPFSYKKECGAYPAFSGSRVFLKVNELLGERFIDWSL
jgi:uracil-DNA glycosylase